MKHNLILVTLNQEQSKEAKEINGLRKKMTHALICGSYGQIFGTEKYCRKYYSAWSQIFPCIFDRSIETIEHDIVDYETTFNLVNKLIEINDTLEKSDTASRAGTRKNDVKQKNKKTKNSFFSKLFGTK